MRSRTAANGRGATRCTEIEYVTYGLASPYYHCGPVDIITHPKACGKAPVRVQTSLILNQELR